MELMDIGLDAKRKIMTEVISSTQLMNHTWSYYRHKPVMDLTRKTTNYGQPRDPLQLTTFSIPVSKTINKPYTKYKLNCILSLYNKLFFN
jgi:hypothetical protein